MKNEIAYSKKDDKSFMLVKTYYETKELYRSDSYVNKRLIEGYCLDKQGNKIEHIPFMIFPEFPGGDRALRAYIKQSIRYPKEAKEARIQGRCFVNFTIDETGKVINPKIVRGINQHLDKEALRVVSNLPDWKPGEQEG